MRSDYRIQIVVIHEYESEYEYELQVAKARLPLFGRFAIHAEVLHKYAQPTHLHIHTLSHTERMSNKRQTASE